MLTIGTTPTIKFEFDEELKWEDYAKVILTIQSSIKDQLNIEKDRLTYKDDENSVTVKLTQEETLKFKPDNIVEVQFKFKLSNDDLFATNIERLTFSNLLNKEIV